MSDHVIAEPEFIPLLFKEPHFLENDDLSFAVALLPDNLIFDQKMPDALVDGGNQSCLPDVMRERWPYG